MINHYEQIPGGNFGDDLNEILWEQVFAQSLTSIGEDDQYFLGIGTRLRRKNIPTGKKIIVFGSGYGYETTPPKVDSYWDVRCVRGPLTAQALSIDSGLAITDPAILSKRFFEKKDKVFVTSFIPHHLTTWEDDWEKVCHSVDINYIDPRKPPNFVLDEIAKSEVIITESLHGAIIADTFRIPWIPFHTRSHFSQFKWNDWAESMDLKIEFNPIRPLFNKGMRNKQNFKKLITRKIYASLLSDSMARKSLNGLKLQKSFLSTEDRFQERYEQMEDCVSRFLVDYVR